MDELQQQITDEIAAITIFLEQRLGRRSRWNGVVELSDDPSAFGHALWSGAVSINGDLAVTDVRWRTEIHESLHLLSAGLTPRSYVELEGWEEGVVEQLQRLLRPEIFAAFGLIIPEKVFDPDELRHSYNKYLSALERLRAALNEPLPPFYENLLALPLTERPNDVIRGGQRLPQGSFRNFQREFAIAFSVLRGG